MSRSLSDDRALASLILVPLIGAPVLSVAGLLLLLAAVGIAALVVLGALVAFAVRAPRTNPRPPWAADTRVALGT
jgi:hypothetical protein